MRYTYQNFRSRIKQVLEEYADKTAITYMRNDGTLFQVTYSGVLEIIESIKKVISDIELVRAARIAIISKHTPETVVLNLALGYLGYTAVLLDAGLPKEEINRLVEYADVSALFTTEEVYGNIRHEVKKGIPCFSMQNGFMFSKFEDSARRYEKEVIEPCCTDTIAIIFSSGTTAQMKGIMVTYHSILYAHQYMLQYTNLNSSATFLDVLPSNHIAGYSSAMSCFLTGTELGFISDMSAENLLSGFLNYKPTNFIMIPKVYEVMRNKIEDAIEKKTAPVRWYAKMAMKICGSVRERTGIKLRFLTKPIWKAALGSNMKICGCGTLPCSEELMRFYLNLGIDFVNVYGATETGFPITAANCNDKYPIYGTGNVKQFSEVEVVIHEPDVEGIGEIRVKTPLIMKGYFKERELTERAFDEKGYFKTGDMGYIDVQGNLYVTGRIKESILLHSGKKVSPMDIDRYYQQIVPGMVIASCGVERADGYDGIYLFVEKGTYSEAEVNHALERLKEASRDTTMYKAEQIVVAEKIPMTTVGKVKRYLLKEYVGVNKAVEVQNETQQKEGGISNEELEQETISLIQKFVTDVEVTLDSNIKKELGLDSLAMFELCTELESRFGIPVVKRLGEITTIRDIVNWKEKNIVEKRYSLKDFPKQRTKKDFRFIARFWSICHLFYKIEVSGLKHIPREESFLLCPNHESYMDGMWIAAAVQESGTDITGFCCMAAEELMEARILKKGFHVLGGIPVNRKGNTVLVMKRLRNYMRDTERSIVMMHPEGTRSRDGKLGEFKNGAALLAKSCNKKIIPVCINGAYEIFPPSAKLPRIFNWRKLRRYQLSISFGPAIDPEGKTEEEITQKIKDYIVKQKGKYRW